MTRFLVALVLVTPFSSPAEAQRTVTPEAILFQQYRDGVFTIFGDGGSGSGFLISNDGLLLTNQHVVGNSRYVRVQLDDSIKVAALLVAADETLDLAVLQISPELTRNRPVLKLAELRQELAFEGERIIAIGSPLNQTKILTSGIVSKVEREAIISDVNINPGNSGGPLLNMDGEVIAINTFANTSGTGTPGISGSVSIYLARAIIGRAEGLARSQSPPAAERLPVMPSEIYPLHALEDAARAPVWDMSAYDVSRLTETGGFQVAVYTPASLYRIDKEVEVGLAEQRRGREASSSATPSDAYAPFDDLKRWGQYTGQYAPVVLLQVGPKVGQTTGSAWGNALGAFAAGMSGTSYRGVYTLEFKADLQDIVITRDDEVFVEIQRGMTFFPLSIDAADYYGVYRGQDLARAGILTISPDLFAPSQDGWPTVQLTLDDLKQPGSPIQVTIPRRTMERIWADFEAYREEVAAMSAQHSPQLR